MGFFTRMCKVEDIEFQFKPYRPFISGKSITLEIRIIIHGQRLRQRRMKMISIDVNAFDVQQKVTIQTY